MESRNTHYYGRLLIVDDDVSTCRFWQTVLGEEGFRVDFCHSLTEMKDMLSRYFIDVILLDLDLDQENGLDALPYLVSESPFSKVFILTANASVDSAVDALRTGATDYITKSTEPKEIAAKLKEAISQGYSVSLEDEGEPFRKHGMIGQSRCFTELCGTIEQVKDVDSTLLLLGESGTGKEVVARTIHRLSNRQDRRFEAINCAAIPENLLESELFGHKKGAFTDAKGDRKGIFELCTGGTLLLDEIGDMPITLQTKLLRVLQEREVVPVGSSRSVAVDTRVIAATHRDLLEEIQSGNFREDLYFRLSVVPVKIPPLRHRKDDIKVLIDHFLQELNQRFGKRVKPPANDVMKRLLAYDWPGNVRELRNAVERGVVLSRNSELLVENLFRHLEKSEISRLNLQEGRGDATSSPINEDIFDMPLTDAKQAFEKAYIQRLLQLSKGNIAEVARQSGRYRADIYRLFDKYGIDHDSYREGAGKG